jgi:hypothetical protein
MNLPSTEPRLLKAAEAFCAAMEDGPMSADKLAIIASLVSTLCHVLPVRLLKATLEQMWENLPENAGHDTHPNRH